MAEAALPIAGRALGTVGGGPVGGMIGGKLASAAGWMFGLELEGLSAEDREFEVARRFARFASATTKNALSAPPTANPQTVAKRAAAVAGRRLAPGLIRQGAAALSNTANGKGGAAIGGETEKKEGEMRVRLRFFVDGYSQNSRPLRIFKLLYPERFQIVLAEAGLPTSPQPLFWPVFANTERPAGPASPRRTPPLRDREINSAEAFARAGGCRKRGHKKIAVSKSFKHI